MVVAAGFCVWIYEYHKLATVKSFKADISSITRSSELWVVNLCDQLFDDTKLLLSDS